MGWLTNAAIRESKLLKKLLGLSSYQLDSNGNVIGFLGANGLPMASKAVTWAEFLTLGSGDVQDRSAVWVYDKNCMFVWNDLAARWYPVGNGRLTFATFDLLPLPTANINGLCAWVESGIGIGGAWVEVRLIGAAYFWRYTAGRALVSAINADVLFVPSDGNYTTESLVKTFAIPLNNSKSLVQDGDFFDADKILACYKDWKDTTLWPTSNKRVNELKENSKKQEDPETKNGIIGAWCRTYGIEEVIELFLSEVYVPTQDGRYTFVNGTTASGLVIYEDKFAYSHHGTDPAGGKLCNAFDLVRLHKFGHLDSDSDQKPKSMSLMEDFARKDAEVKKTIGVENLAKAKYDFANEVGLEDDDNLDWMQDLEVDKAGKYLTSATNLNIILANDVRLKNKFKRNLFENRDYIFDSVPWRTIDKPEPVRNVDYAGVRNYIESIYGIARCTKVLY